jgi:hypothetical protein
MVPYLMARDGSGTQKRSRGEGTVNINNEDLRPKYMNGIKPGSTAVIQVSHAGKKKKKKSI